MKQLEEKEELSGKTILRIAYTENKFFLFFTDNSFCVIQGLYWGDDPDVEILSSAYSFEPHSQNYRELRDIGMITNEKVIEIQAMIKERDRLDLENAELRQLIALRKKYPTA